MKYVSVLLAIAAAMLCLRLSGASSETLQTAGPATMASGKVAPDGSAVVAAFYQALVQDEPPTLEQEKSLFVMNSGLRAHLVATGRGKAEEPVLLTLFRANKEMFLPLNMRSLADVQISQEFAFFRNVERMKDPPKLGNGNVMVLFNHDRLMPPPQRSRTLVFRMEGGKIEPYGIQFDGFEGKLAGDVFREK